GHPGRGDRLRVLGLPQRRALAEQHAQAGKLEDGERGPLRLRERRQGPALQEALIMIRGLHHSAYRCRDSEETRRFYEDFLGLPLVNAFEIKETKSGRPTKTLHSFYGMDDGSCLAFFEAPDLPFQFKTQHDFDLHIAVEVGREDLDRMLE